MIMNDGLIVTALSANAAEAESAAEDFALVHDLFAAHVAIHAQAWARNDFFNGDVQCDFLNGQHFCVWHGLISLHLREVMAEFFWRERTSLLADIQPGRNTERAARSCVHESRGDFAIILHAHSAVTDGAARCRCDTVYKTSIRFGDDEHFLLGGWFREAKRDHACQPNPHAKDLARADVCVVAGGSFE
jgi:hypothetical protein